MAILSGTSGADRLAGTAAADTLNGLDGNDTLIGRGGNDIVSGGSGNDTLRGGAGNDTISGGDGADTIVGGRGADVLSGGNGNDAFLFAYGDGKDTISDFAAGDVLKISGYSAAQSVTQVGTSVVVALSLTDTITLSNATVAAVNAALQFGSTMSGGTGGTTGTITGSSGNDTLNGTAGNDVINGLGGNDTIYGGGGNDVISGGVGADTLTGGSGSDTFVYASAAESLPGPYVSDGGDWIMSWEALDHIDLSAIDANTTIAGNQSFQFAGYSFAQPPSGHAAGTLYIGGFVNQLWIIGFTDGDTTPDLLINLAAPGEEASLKVANLTL